MENSGYSLGQLVRYFLRLGTLGFGGPVALVGYMRRDLVDQRKWVTEEEFREGLALAQLAPGPLAAQLAMYLGFVNYRARGAAFAGIAFVLPSFMMVLVLGFLYVRGGGLTWVQSLFYGIGSAVIGIITWGAFKLVRKTIKMDLVLWICFAVILLTTAIFEKEILWLIVASGFFSWYIKTRKERLISDALFMPAIFLFQSAYPGTFSQKILGLGWFFLKAGTFVFGSGLAIVPFLYGGLVKEQHWLNETQFLDAVAIAMITPGPVVITVGFIGFIIAGFPGAFTAALATFLPCYIFTVLPAPYFKKYGNRPGIRAFVDGITAGAFGAIGGAVIVLARRQLTDWPSIIIAISTLAILVLFKKIPEPVIILVAALAGLALKEI
jgi:chromate transporter